MITINYNQLPAPKILTMCIVLDWLYCLDTIRWLFLQQIKQNVTLWYLQTAHREHNLGNLLHLRLKPHTRVIVRPSTRDGSGEWKEALTSKMLWSVIIDILIALVVIFFGSVLFPLSSPGSPYLLDKTQEAVHVSRTAQPGSAPEESNSPAAPGAGGASAPVQNLGPGARYPAIRLWAPISVELLDMGGGENNRHMGFPWQDSLLCS